MIWQVNKIATILKEHAIKTSYDVFRDRKISSAICLDLLSEFDEGSIITMLFREGLGECLQGAPYTTSYDVSLAKSRVRTFVKKLGLNDFVVENVVDFVGIFTDAKAKKVHTSAIEILNEQKEQARNFREQQHQTISVKKESDFDHMICSDVETLIIRSSYQGKRIPSLKPFKKLKKFSNFFPLTWSKVSEINMQNLYELYFCNADSNSNIIITAPMLEKLIISGSDKEYKELTPLERMLRSVFPKLEICARRLKYLEIMHMSGYDLSAIGNLENLDTLIIRHTELTDMSWLEGCMNLKKLYIYSEVQEIGDIPIIESLQELHIDYAEIETLENIKLFPNLSVLSLRGNKISSITKTDNLQHITRIDLSRNPIADTKETVNLETAELILSDADREIYNFDRKIGDIFHRAYLSYASREKNLESLFPYTKRNWTSKSEEEKYVELVNCIFEDSFYSCSPASFTMKYDTKIKRQYLEFVKERFPFIKIKDDFEKQIQREYFGASYFYREKPGNIIYANESLYIIQVKLEDGDGCIQAQFKNTGGEKLSNSLIEKVIKEKCDFIDFKSKKITIEVFDLYHTGKLDGLEFGIVAAIFGLSNDIILHADCFISGEYNKQGSFKRNSLSSRILNIAELQKVKNVYFFTSIKSRDSINSNIKINYCNALSDLKQ